MNKGIGQKLMAGTSMNPKSKIPKVIIQTMTNTDKLPAAMLEASSSWKKQNPSYEHILFSGDDRIEFIKNFYDKEMLTIYSSLSHNSFKADLFRMCYLYKKGGIYVDIDFACNKSVDTIIKEDRDIVAGIANNQINMGMLITAPESPIFKHILETGTRRFFEKKPIGEQWKLWGNVDVGYFGPPAMTYSWGYFHERFKREEDIKVVYEHPCWTKNIEERKKIKKTYNFCWRKGNYTKKGLNFTLLNKAPFTYICSDKLYSQKQYITDLESMGLKHWSPKFHKRWLNK